MRLLSLAVGVFLYLFVVLFCFTYNGGHFESILHPGELMGVVFAPWVSLCTAYGMRGAFRQFGALFRARTPADAAEAQRFLSLWIAAAYGAGFLFLLLGLIVMMGFIAGNPVKIGEKIAAAMVAPVIALILVEGVLRPLRHRIGRE